MAEVSYVWGETSVGDAVYAPYASSEYAGLTRLLFVQDNTKQGVIKTGIPGYTGFLNGVITDVSTFTIDTGVGIVDGIIYLNTDEVAIDVDACAGGKERYDRVVLSKVVASQTVRIAILTGDEVTAGTITDSEIPALTQTVGVTWQIPLWVIYVDDTGITRIKYDERYTCYMPLIEENPYLAGGRLSLDKDVPYQINDIDVAGGEVYYSPYVSNKISLWDTTCNRYVSCDIEQYDSVDGTYRQHIVIDGMTGTGQYDIFLYKSDNSIKFDADLVVGLNGRTTCLPMNEGIYCKAGEIHKRYIGSVYSVSGAIYDTYAMRQVWNMNNRVRKTLYYGYSSVHEYKPAVLTWRVWDGGVVTAVVNWVSGEPATVKLGINGPIVNPYLGYGYLSIGIDDVLLPNNSIGMCGGYIQEASKYYSTDGSVVTTGYHWCDPIEAAIDVSGTGSDFSEMYINGYIEC